MTAEETEELVDAVLNKELARAKRKKRPTEQSIQEDIKVAETPKATKRPKSGGMTFEELEKMDTNTETNKSGFES